jgi:hypothetical protein
MYLPFLRSFELSRYINLQCLQAMLPELAVGLQPLVSVSQRAGINPAMMFPAFDLAAHQAAFENPVTVDYSPAGRC